MSRLFTMSTINLTNAASFSMTYQYDAVGSARTMVQASNNLLNKAKDAIITWEYDDRYRLTAETRIAGGSPAHRTTYTWDAADNRLFKGIYEIDGAITSTVSSITYTPNALNQMTGYVESNSVSSVYSVVDYLYDANGARTNMVRTAGGSPATTTYAYDEDNRLITAVAGVGDPGEAISTFAYNYRSRRYHRTTPTEETYHVFDGGLAVQEYTVPPASSGQPVVEFIRGEGMGVGVGGMVYSIRNGNIICSHANHRGDIIARSNFSGSLTSYALYEAFGTRPYEWGSDPDRQKANTKEEETDLNLLNEGMRYRDLATGTFLTRDPIGFADGPNVYCYVHCNPITRFDAFGLLDIYYYNPSSSTGKDYSEFHAAQAVADGREAISVSISSPKQLVENMQEHARAGENIEKVTILDHGVINVPGKQRVGETSISDKQFAQIGGLMKTKNGETPRLDLKGCSFAKGSRGEAALQKVADISRTDVTAATDLRKINIKSVRGTGKVIGATETILNDGKDMTKSPRSEITVDNVKRYVSGDRGALLKPIKNGAKIYGEKLEKRVKKVPEKDYTIVKPEIVDAYENIRKE